MTSKKELQTALDSLWERYAGTLSLLDDALDKLDEKPKEVIREVVVPLSTKQEQFYQKEITRLKTQISELEKKLKAKPKTITKEVPVEVEVEKIVEVEKVVEKPVEIEKIVEVEKLVEVPGPERIVEKEIEVPVEVVKEVIKEKVVEGPRRTQTIELPATGDLRAAATLIANSEMNVNDLSTEEILTMLKNLSEEEVNNKLGFWAIPLPTDGDEDNTGETRYTIKK